MANGATPDRTSEPSRSRDTVVADVEVGRLGSLAANGIAWSMVKQWGSRVISILLFLVLTRTLEPADIGLVAFATVFIGFLDTPLRSSLGDALVQRPELRNSQLDSAFCALLGASTALALAMSGAATFLGRAFGNSDVAPVIMALSLGLPLTGLSVIPEALLRRQMRFKSLAVRRLVADVVAGAVALALAFAGAGAWALVARILVQSTATLVVAYASVEWRPRLRFSWGELRDIAVFGGWSMANSLIGFATRHNDDLIIGITLGTVALGYYAVAYQVLVMVVLLVTDTIDSTAMSAFSRLQEDRQRVGRAFALGVRTSLAVVMAIAAMTVALAPSIIVHLFGPKWLPSTDVLRVLIVGSLVAPAMSLSMTVMKSRGRPDLAVRAVAIRTAIAVVAVLIGASFGLVWVGVAQIATALLVSPFYFRTVHGLCTVSWRSVLWTAARLLVAGTAAGAVAVLAAGGWREPVGSLWLLVACSALGAAVYAALVWLLARRDVHEVIGFVRARKASSGATRSGGRLASSPQGAQP
jgi:O-antigen/teichoic acid export membrane protein